MRVNKIRITVKYTVLATTWLIRIMYRSVTGTDGHCHSGNNTIRSSNICENIHPTYTENYLSIYVSISDIQTHNSTCLQNAASIDFHRYVHRIIHKYIYTSTVYIYKYIHTITVYIQVNIRHRE